MFVVWFSPLAVVKSGFSGMLWRRLSFMNRHHISLGNHIDIDACPKDRKTSDIGCWYLISDAAWGGD